MEVFTKNNNKMILHVICVAYKRVIPLRILIDSFLTQTNPNWELHIIHDGEAPSEVKSIISLYQDSRITFQETLKVNGHWGHVNRNICLKQLTLNHRDFVLMTNDDNYYVPKFVECFLKECRRNDIGMVFCDTVHSYLDYDVMRTIIKEDYIDMGSFVVRVDVAKRIGFNHIHLSADGAYAVECANYCRVRKLKITHISKCYFIHN